MEKGEEEEEVLLLLLLLLSWTHKDPIFKKGARLRGGLRTED